MKLSPKQLAFCTEYVVDLNATQAAIRAGYSPMSQRWSGHRLMAQPAIRARIASLMDERDKRTMVNADYIVQNLVALINKCIVGVPVRIWSKELQQWVDSGENKTNPAAAIKALEILGKHLHLFDKKEIKKHQSLGALQPEQFERILEAIRNDEPYDPALGL